MNILLCLLASTLIFVDMFALRKLEKKNKELTNENMKLKRLIDRGV